MKNRAVHHHMPPPHPMALRSLEGDIHVHSAAFGRQLSHNQCHNPVLAIRKRRQHTAIFGQKDNFSEHPVSAALLYSSPPPLNIV